MTYYQHEFIIQLAAELENTWFVLFTIQCNLSWFS